MMVIHGTPYKFPIIKTALFVLNYLGLIVEQLLRKARKVECLNCMDGGAV